MAYTAKQQTIIKTELVLHDGYDRDSAHEEVEQRITKAIAQTIYDVLGDNPKAADVKKIRIVVESEDN